MPRLWVLTCHHEKEENNNNNGWFSTGTDLGFQARGPELSKKKIKKIQIHIHIVLRNFQTKQIHKNHYFLNIKIQLSTNKNKRTKDYYFLIHRTLLFFLFFLRFYMGWVDYSWFWRRLKLQSKGGPSLNFLFFTEN